MKDLEDLELAARDPLRRRLPGEAEFSPDGGVACRARRRAVRIAERALGLRDEVVDRRSWDHAHSTVCRAGLGGELREGGVEVLELRRHRRVRRALLFGLAHISVF